MHVCARKIEVWYFFQGVYGYFLGYLTKFLLQIGMYILLRKLVFFTPANNKYYCLFAFAQNMRKLGKDHLFLTVTGHMPTRKQRTKKKYNSKQLSIYWWIYPCNVSQKFSPFNRALLLHKKYSSKKKAGSNSRSHFLMIISCASSFNLPNFTCYL